MRVESYLCKKEDKRYIIIEMYLNGKMNHFTFDVTGVPIHKRQRKRMEYLKMFRRLVLSGEPKNVERSED